MGGLDEEVTMKQANSNENTSTDPNAFETFKVGDPVSWSAGTDTRCGTVVRLTKTKVFIQEVEATLLNGPNSGEPDALHFAPGGFCGHMSGVQRHSFAEPSGPERAFSRRNLRNGSTVAKQQGTSMSGSMSSWGRLRHGHAAHYDFNF